MKTDNIFQFVFYDERSKNKEGHIMGYTESNLEKSDTFTAEHAILIESGIANANNNMVQLIGKNTWMKLCFKGEIRKT